MVAKGLAGGEIASGGARQLWWRELIRSPSARTFVFFPWKHLGNPAKLGVVKSFSGPIVKLEVGIVRDAYIHRVTQGHDRGVVLFI